MSPRRKSISLMLAMVAAVAVPAEVGADRYQNQSGLRLGSFVWNPSVDEHGTVAIVVSLAEGVLHVFRGGRELAIVPIAGAVPAGSARELTFARLQAAAHNRGVWEAAPLLGGGSLPGTGGRPRVTVPDELAGLLADATRAGAFMLVTPERSVLQSFAAFGPYRTELATGTIGAVASEAGIVAAGNVARFAAPDISSSFVKARPAEVAIPALEPVAPGAANDGANVPASKADAAPVATEAVEADQSDAVVAKDADARKPSGDLSAATAGAARVPNANAALIVSRADGAAYLVEDQAVVRSVPVSVERPDESIGQHAYLLIAPAEGERAAQWLGFGVANDASAPDVTEQRSRDAFERVRFHDTDGNVAITAALAAGSIVILTDEPGVAIADASRRGGARTTVAAIGAQSIRPSEPQAPVYAEQPEPAAEESAEAAAASEEPPVVEKLSPAAARRRLAGPARKNAKRPKSGQTAKSSPSSADWSERLFRPY